MSSINLAALPAPQVIEALDYEQILEQWLADFLAIYPEGADVLELESEPLKKLMEVGAYREMMQRAHFNSQAKGLFLAYATQGDLDHIGVTYFEEPRLADETDDAYRLRLSLKPSSYSTAGAANSYRYFALSASPDILDAKAQRTAPGEVTVAVLESAAPGTASTQILQLVEAALNDDDVRPLTDTVIVKSAVIESYAVQAVIHPKAGPSSAPVLQAAIDKLTHYTNQQRALGAGIKRDAVLAALWVEGVAHVDLISPVNNLTATWDTSTHATTVDVSLA